MKKHLFIVFCLFLIVVGLTAQAGSPNLTIQRNTNFQQAIRILENFSLQFDNRNIVNLSSFTGGVPIQINNMHWNEALHLIVNTLDLQIEARPGAFIITDIVYDVQGPVVEVSEINDKMVRIHATFFYADRTFMNNIGIDWSTLVDGHVMGTMGLNTSGGVADQFSMSAAYSFDQGGYIIDLEGLFRFFESNQLGTILARPAVTVLSGREGFVQVGQDFSVKTQDDAGNTIDVFFQTGIILQVRPVILEDEDGFEAIFLEASIENSTAVPGNVSTIINKNQVRTDAILFDGEETVLAGLIDMDMTRERGGIPFLKDLPWWVFGLRYLFGYNSYRNVSREMVIILKTELVNPAVERIRERENFRDQIRQRRIDFEGLQDLLIPDDF
ncbi:MAG: hypothetical protein FWG98_05300 [Candidatus Cloacimonetes bacterium]|nr:hypothetical protein [Candidatus Cloacimonadota bacterium]